MFARKLRVEYEHEGQFHPCPLKWLDNFIAVPAVQCPARVETGLAPSPSD